MFVFVSARVYVEHYQEGRRGFGFRDVSAEADASAPPDVATRQRFDLSVLFQEEFGAICLCLLLPLISLCMCGGHLTFVQ